MQKIILRNISQILDDGETLFEEVNFSLQTPERVGIIGRNGSGKTTLLKIILGQIQPTTGVVAAPKNNSNFFYYLPQQKDSTDEKMKNLSGGEYVRYHINQAKKQKPEVLILDEPTNHLDEKGRNFLQEFIDSYKGILIFVSHDVEFLKKNAENIFYFWNKKLEIFGGNYVEYQEHFAKYLDGLERQKSALKKEESKLKKAMVIEQKRYQKAIQVGKEARREYSTDKFAKGFFKDNSQFSYGKIKAQIERLQETNKKKQNQYELPKDLDVSFIFPTTDNKKSLLIKIENGNLQIADKKLIQNLDFQIYYGEKILLSGDNGSGKSLFVNSFISKNIVAENFFQKENLQIAYLDQFYNIVDRDKTILENVLEKSKDTETARKILSLYGFQEKHVINQKANNLSGGEMCRLSLAKISASQLDMVILDEPTNNIDLETKEVLIQALNKFSGALLLISHDRDFVEKLNIKKVLKIENQKLQKLAE